MINLYYKPHLSNKNKIVSWLEWFIDPIKKSTCQQQGFKCPLDEPCDCEKICGNEYVLFNVGTERIYVMNKKLSPGMYCLPKGVNRCNMKVNYHVFSLAGWSCLPLSEDVFKGDKRRACKSEEAENNDLNVLWDLKSNKRAENDIEDYYEEYNGKMRYQCDCQSKTLDKTPMISVFPFVCSADYCLRDIPNPLKKMGWDGTKCDCKPYFNLDPFDEKSPCRKQLSRIEDQRFIGRVDCMTEDSFIKHSLFCPENTTNVQFTEVILKGSSNPTDFIKMLYNYNYI